MLKRSPQLSYFFDHEGSGSDPDLLGHGALKALPSCLCLYVCLGPPDPPKIPGSCFATTATLQSQHLTVNVAEAMASNMPCSCHIDVKSDANGAMTATVLTTLSARGVTLGGVAPARASAVCA